jgi:uncharacterized protein YndB with AHSA1/START domain
MSEDPSEDMGEITACYMVSFKRDSKHSAERLWQAITDADEVSSWMDYPARVDLRVGGEWNVDFSRTDDGGIPGVIVKVEPERVLAYVWGWSVIEWSIEPTDNGCRYTFVQNGLADRGEDEEGLAAGWHGFLDQLEAHLAGEPVSIEAGKARWEERKEPYRKLLEAAIR